LDKDEAVKFMQAFDKDADRSGEDMVKAFEEFDKNGDGRLGKNESYALIC